MNSIFKKSKLDEMQEIKMLKIEHYSFWALYGGLAAALVIQVAQGAPGAQFAGEGIVLLLVSAGSMIASLWSGLWDRKFQPSAGTNALVALAGAVIAGAVNFHYLPGAVMTAGCTWLLTFGILQACSALYRQRRRNLDSQTEEETEEKDDE